MARLNRDIVIAQALDLLDDVGLDAVTTRQLAKRLGVEQPTLYWHFRTKAQLLTAMSEAALAPLESDRLPQLSDDWRAWFLEHARSFRRTLLVRRDGARLHAGSRPGVGDMARVHSQVAFLVSAGLPEDMARIGLLTANRFTVGSVLEEQADADRDPEADASIGIPPIDYASAFEAGLAMIVDGLAKHIGPNV